MNMDDRDVAVRIPRQDQTMNVDRLNSYSSDTFKWLKYSGNKDKTIAVKRRLFNEALEQQGMKYEQDIIDKLKELKDVEASDSEYAKELLLLLAEAIVLSYQEADYLFEKASDSQPSHQAIAFPDQCLTAMKDFITDSAEIERILKCKN